VAMHRVTSDTKVRITDLFGRTVFSTLIPKPDQHYNTREILLPDLPKGIYLVRFSSEEFSETSKLVVE